ncbi:hypothetical protein OSB04_030266 [Centaurea solstitialis]|uniref:non-specific serine/threonine protein kinase n=1 Tax=Centaurea solstitialis TaxID=347529 RepID=A0AA38SSJ8_9ASTR|nr:hypothetical protein OSB04_030266 [Centaurea solstitialis]
MHEKMDRWLMIELCRFTSYKQEHEFKIDLLPVFDTSFSNIQYFLEGIEFRPMEYISPFLPSHKAQIYACPISFFLYSISFDRLKMSSEEFQDLKIHLEDIVSATNNFDPQRLIGRGGFGSVYKGEISLPQGRKTMMAFKRLDPKFGQGNDEFWKEIIMLFRYRHENLVSLQCFCDEGDERILGYELASRGSLDRYLGDPSLTWDQRVKICIGIARALNYLHDPKESQERVLHRDIKSSNILLDEEWNAKVSDFGLSKFGPANQAETYLFSNVVGTPGYCDPLYWEIGFLTKESDIYSFGVVLFEVLCGRICCEYDNGRLSGILVHTWKNRYDENKLDDIVCSNLKEQIELASLLRFSAIASRCLERNRKQRPTMMEIIEELEITLELQMIPQNNKHLAELAKLAEPPLSYKSLGELMFLLREGFRYKDTTKNMYTSRDVFSLMWLSLTENGRVCEMISANKCIFEHKTIEITTIPTEDSRFDYARWVYLDFKIKVSPEFLEPNVTYSINLIYQPQGSFKLGSQWEVRYRTCLPFKYKLDEETKHSGLCIPKYTEKGWLSVQLYQFTCREKEHFTIECSSTERIGPHHIEGIEFRPVEYGTEEVNMLNLQDIDLEPELPPDYLDLIKWSKKTIRWTTKKELYLILRQGFVIDNGQKWFSIDKRMKNRYMIPPKAFLKEHQWIFKDFPTSRFGVAAECQANWHFKVKCEINLGFEMSCTRWSCHLIYKLAENNPLLTNIASIHVKHAYSESSIYLYVPKDNEKSDTPLDIYKIHRLPKLRKDGWMECILWEGTSPFLGNSLVLDSKLDGLVYFWVYQFYCVYASIYLQQQCLRMINGRRI